MQLRASKGESVIQDVIDERAEYESDAGRGHGADVHELHQDDERRIVRRCANRANRGKGNELLQYHRLHALAVSWSSKARYVRWRSHPVVGQRCETHEEYSCRACGPTAARIGANLLVRYRRCCTGEGSNRLIYGPLSKRRRNRSSQLGATGPGTTGP